MSLIHLIVGHWRGNWFDKIHGGLLTFAVLWLLFAPPYLMASALGWLP